MMPDTISMSASVSLGLLAGIVSGVCYLVANGVAWNKSQEEDSKACARVAGSAGDEECRRCGGELRGGAVPCICQHKSHKLDSGHNSGWLLRQIQRAMYHMPWGLSTDRLEQIDEECEAGDVGGSKGGGGELRNVREFLEALSARLAGGDLAATSVAPLYRHHDYLPPSSHSTPVSVSSDVHGGASSAHAQLKRLVSRVVEEAAALPALARYAAEPPHMPSLESSTYEDLLASAILNKVIERYQTENGSGGRSSGIHSASASPTPSERSSPRSLNQRHAREVSPSLREEDDASDWEEGDASEEALDVPRRVPFPEFGGDIIHHTDNEDRDFDEVSSSDIQAVDGSWEENWLFQKKKIKTLQSVPVPMLVPNSNTEYRAMIGDRDADDTTDLSDNASDTESDPHYRSNIKRVLDSKHVIGGKTKMEEILDYEPDSLTFIDGSDDFIKLDEKQYMKSKDVVDSVHPETEENIKKEDANENVDNLDIKNSVLVLGIDSGPLAKTEFSLKEEIHRTTMNKNNYNNSYTEVNRQAGNTEDIFSSMTTNSNVSMVSRHEREGEYEETVTLPVQRYADSLRRKHFDDETQHIPTRDTDVEDELLPGTIAYRERKKWLNAVDMPNNPYSPEAIQRRLSAKSTSSMFDTLTAKSKDIDGKPNGIPEKTTKLELQTEQGLEKDKKPFKNSLTVDEQSNGFQQNGDRSKSPSPKILKDALSEEVPQYKRYGRDYYIKEAKAAAGGRKRGTFSDTSSISSMNKSVSLDNFDPEFTSPGLLIKQFNTIATNQQYTHFAGNNLELESITTKPKSKSIIMIEYDDNIDTNTLYSAQPAHVNDGTDKQINEMLHTVNNLKPKPYQLELNSNDANNTSFETSDLSASSLDDSIKIYNVPTGEIMKGKHLDNVSVMCESTPDKNENFDIPDNNIPEDTVDSLSQSSDALVDALIIVDSDRNNLEQDTADYNSEVEDILSQLPKVKEIAKKFVSMDNLNEAVKVENQPVRRRKSKDNVLSLDKPVNKQMYMHSLTARSISKEFREELRQSMTTPLKVPGGSKEIPEGIEEVVKESSRPGSPLPEPGTIKTKLAFFESLKNKFNGK